MEKQKNAVGRRKEAVTRVFLSKGDGKITINGKDYKTYFPLVYLQNQVESPLKTIDSINKFLITLVQKSIKEYIEENGSWNISKGNWSSEYDEFSRKTIRKYCVQITSVDMTQYGGDFECKFKVVGKLAKLFKSHNVFNQFEVSITNDSGEEYTSISNTERCDRRVSTVHCYARNVNNWNADEYKNFLQVISKDFLFEIIKEA